MPRLDAFLAQVKSLILRGRKRLSFCYILARLKMSLGGTEAIDKVLNYLQLYSGFLAIALYLPRPFSLRQHPSKLLFSLFERRFQVGKHMLRNWVGIHLFSALGDRF
ncbi:hypothetical protein O77CONTIG1_02501 [Leptolyngbya sp. O-77]|nr:hypothetical protein O77CONTIG1_02501 [Leptolyngbya sp. O-77]